MEAPTANGGSSIVLRKPPAGGAPAQTVTAPGAHGTGAQPNVDPAPTPAPATAGSPIILRTPN
jgi:hypothetical protein